MPDGGSADIDDSSGKDVVVRLFATPFLAQQQRTGLEQLGFGLAASVGEREGTAAAPGLPTFRTTSQQTFARYRADGVNTAIADGRHWRVSPQGQFYLASFGAITEYVFSSQDVRQGITQRHGTKPRVATLDVVRPDRRAGLPAHRPADARWIRKAAAGAPLR